MRVYKASLSCTMKDSFASPCEERLLSLCKEAYNTHPLFAYRENIMRHICTAIMFMNRINNDYAVLFCHLVLFSNNVKLFEYMKEETKFT